MGWDHGLSLVRAREHILFLRHFRHTQFTLATKLARLPPYWVEMKSFRPNFRVADNSARTPFRNNYALARSTVERDPFG